MGPLLGNTVGGFVFEHFGAVILFRGGAATVFVVFVIFMASERPWQHLRASTGVRWVVSESRVSAALWC